MSCARKPCMSPPDPVLRDVLRTSKIFLTFTSIAMAVLCGFIIRMTPSISKEYAYLLMVVATQFDVYAQLVLDPQYTKTIFCVYQDAPLLSIYFNALWGYVFTQLFLLEKCGVWITLVACHPPIYAACFIHRHQIIVPPHSIFKLNSKIRHALLFGLTIFCLFYGYTYYLAWDPVILQGRLTPDWDPLIVERMECMPYARSYTAVLFAGSVIFVAAISLHTFSILRRARNISAKTRSFHRIMMRSLIIVAAVPLSLIVGPFAFVGYYYINWTVFAKLNTVPLMDICTLVNSFHSVVHSTVLILTTPVFRKRLIEIVCKRKRQIVVSPITEKASPSGREFSITHVPSN